MLDKANVSLLSFFFLSVFCLSCSTDLVGEKERQSIIDEINLLINEEDCEKARESIIPLFKKYPDDDEVRIVRASVEACFTGFELLDLVVNLIDDSSVYNSVASSLNVEVGDGKMSYLYTSLDIATSNNTNSDPSKRSKLLNDFIMFLQIAVIGGILNSYGDANANGEQVTDLDYLPSGTGTLADEDACALLIAHSSIANIVPYSSFSDDGDVGRAQSRILTACGLSGSADCNFAGLEDRSSCEDSNQVRATVDTFVGVLNVLW